MIENIMGYKGTNLDVITPITVYLLRICVFVYEEMPE